MTAIILTELFQTHAVVVRPAVDQPVLQAEHVALGELSPASHAVEAGKMVDKVTGSHHQLIGSDTVIAPSASLHAEQSGTRKNNVSKIEYTNDNKLFTNYERINYQRTTNFTVT